MFHSYENVYVYSATINFPLNKQRVICKKETGEMRGGSGGFIEKEKLRIAGDGAGIYDK